MLTVKSLELSIGGSRILRGVDFEVPEHKVFCLMGRNGVGKTSTLRSHRRRHETERRTNHARMERTSRSFRPTRAQPPASATSRRGAISSHSSPWRRTCASAPSHSGKKLNGSLERVFSLFPILKEFLPRKGGMLSGGQQQQLAIGRALLTEPKMLILDEPTEGIQPNIIDQIGEAIKLLRRGGHHDEPGLLAEVNQSLKTYRKEGAPDSPLVAEATEILHVLLREGLGKHPAMFNRFAECIDQIRKQQPEGTRIGDEIGSALRRISGESKMSILLVEQYLDFCRELADVFAIMDRGTVVASGPVEALTDAVVQQHLTV